jgi:tetratricopeptide (TPR) repeat protein
LKLKFSIILIALVTLSVKADTIIKNNEDVRIFNKNIKFQYKELNRLMIESGKTFDINPKVSYQLLIEGLEKAKELFNEELSLQKKKSLLNYIADFEKKIGTYYYYDNRFIDAQSYWLKSQKKFELVGDIFELSGVYSNLGVVYSNYLKDYRKSLTYHFKSYKAKKLIGDTAFMHITLANIASEYHKMGIRDSADYFYKHAILLGRKSSDIKGYVEISSNYATFKYLYNEIDTAKILLHEALNILENDIDFPRVLVNTKLTLAYIMLKEGDLKQAQKIAESTYFQSRELNFSLNILSATKLLKEIYSKTKQWEKAFEMTELYRTINDSIISDDNARMLLDQEYRFNYEQQSFADSVRYELAKSEQNLLLQEKEIKIRDNRVIIFSTIFTLVVLILIFFLVSQKNKRKILMLKQIEDNLRLNQLDTEQRLLRAQMNPHFIFNALNSIQSLIVDKEIELSSEYLVSFSTLMRLILFQSRKNRITLQEEIQTLRLYLEMEQLRFVNKFEFKINCEEGLPISKIKLPPMLIQPFVENSVIHGIANLKEIGLIKINFKRDNAFLICTIDDNGIGREEAKKYEKYKNKADSVGVLLTKERLSEHNRMQTTKNYENRSAVIYSDKFNEDNKSSGTKVELNILIKFENHD